MKEDQLSLALAEEWLESLQWGSVANRRPGQEMGDPLAPRTIQRYRDVVVGRANPVYRRRIPAVSLLQFWGSEAPGEHILSISRDQWLEWMHRDVRDGDGTKPPSDSELNNRRSASQNFFKWAASQRGLDVDVGILLWRPSYDSRASTRRKMVKLNPIGDGEFMAIWLASEGWLDELVWIGLGAFMTQRIGEMANLKPWEVDLDRGMATFGAKGGKRRTVHYRDLQLDWEYLPHLRGVHKQWLTVFELHVAERQAEDLPWVCSYVRGAERPHRDNPRTMIPYATMRDLNQFDKEWQRALKRAGFAQRAFNPHQLRHLAAVNMWRSGKQWDSLKEEMGHDQGATTHAYIDFGQDRYNRERARNERKRRDQD